MSSESEGDTGSTPRYRSIGTKRARSSEEPENGDAPVIKRISGTIDSLFPHYSTVFPSPHSVSLK